MGGTRAVPIALAKLARELGVEFRTNTHISTGSSLRAAHVTGVRTNHGEEIALRAVVSNCDSVRTHRELIGRQRRREVRESPQIRTRVFRRRAVSGFEQAL